jgi:hypothetical protein
MAARRASVYLAGLILIGTLTACSSSNPGADRAGDQGASSDSAVTATANPVPAGTRPWWIVGGSVTPGEVRPDGPDPVRGALDALVAGPTPGEAAFGAGTAIEAGVVVQSFTVGPDGVATVDFNRKFETRDTRPQVAQVVYTLTQFPQVTKVRFLIEGQPNGATGVPPVGRSDLRFPANPR